MVGRGSETGGPSEDEGLWACTVGCGVDTGPCGRARAQGCVPLQHREGRGLWTRPDGAPDRRHCRGRDVSPAQPSGVVGRHPHYGQPPYARRSHRAMLTL